jgi:hypothetical protein
LASKQLFITDDLNTLEKKKQQYWKAKVKMVGIFKMLGISSFLHSVVEIDDRDDALRISAPFSPTFGSLSGLTTIGQAYGVVYKFVASETAALVELEPCGARAIRSRP